MGLRNECFERGQRIAALERENAELNADVHGVYDGAHWIATFKRVKDRDEYLDLRARLDAAEEAAEYARQDRVTAADLIRNLRRDLAVAEGEVGRLREALTLAKNTIRAWHSTPSRGGPEEERLLWGLYQGSPEMKIINAALAPPATPDCHSIGGSA